MKLFFSVVLITGYSTTPPPVSSVMSPGWQLSALQPTNQAASKVSLMIPENSLAKGWYCISQAIFAISSKTLFPLNFKFFYFFFFFHFWVVLECFDVLRGAESTTSTRACLFWISFTVLPTFHQLSWPCHHPPPLETDPGEWLRQPGYPWHWFSHWSISGIRLQSC